MEIWFLPRTLLDSEPKAKKEYFGLSGQLGLEVSTTFNLDLDLEDGGDLACAFPCDLFEDGLGEELVLKMDLSFLDLGLDDAGLNHRDVKDKCEKLKYRLASVLEVFANKWLPQCTAVFVRMETPCGTFKVRQEIQRSA
jgi:hypothetical protein